MLTDGKRRPTFMARPAGIAGVPPGLEYLTQVDQILVHQQIEIFEGLASVLRLSCCLPVLAELPPDGTEVRNR